MGGNPLDMWSLHSSLLCRSPDVSANRVNLHLRPPPRILEHARRDRARPDHPSDVRLDQVLYGAHFNPDRLRRGHYLPQKACGQPNGRGRAPDETLRVQSRRRASGIPRAVPSEFPPLLVVYVVVHGHAARRAQGGAEAGHPSLVLWRQPRSGADVEVAYRPRLNNLPRRGLGNGDVGHPQHDGIVGEFADVRGVDVQAILYQDYRRRSWQFSSQDCRQRRPAVADRIERFGRV